MTTPTTANDWDADIGSIRAASKFSASGRFNLYEPMRGSRCRGFFVALVPPRFHPTPQFFSERSRHVAKRTTPAALDGALRAAVAAEIRDGPFARQHHVGIDFDAERNDLLYLLFEILLENRGRHQCELACA